MILDLFGEAAANAEQIFGREVGPNKVLKFDSGAAEQALLAASARRVWSPAGHVRGRGFWRDEEGGLIVHAGNRILVRGQWHEAGLHGDHVYPAAIDLPLPQPPADPGNRFAAGQEVLALFERWNWHRSIDSRLALGDA